MGERSKGKLSHASSYGSSGQDRFHSGAAHEAYWKNHRGNNQSIPNWQRDRFVISRFNIHTLNIFII